MGLAYDTRQNASNMRLKTMDYEVYGKEEVQPGSSPDQPCGLDRITSWQGATVSACQRPKLVCLGPDRR
jgi:hypothetical protein